MKTEESKRETETEKIQEQKKKRIDIIQFNFKISTTINNYNFMVLKGLWVVGRGEWW